MEENSSKVLIPIWLERIDGGEGTKVLPSVDVSRSVYFYIGRQF